MKSLRQLAAIVATWSAIGCATVEPHDYSAFRSHMPDSILVLPPLNRSTDVDAPYSFLSTVSRPLVEAGYYVYPVAVIDAFLKENGLPTPGEMHGIPLDKVREVLDADAILYVDIEDWGQKYRILSSDTVVRVRAQLVDVDTGQTLWSGIGSAIESSGGAQDGVIGMAVNAVLDQVIDSLSDRTHSLARQATRSMVFSSTDGFLRGPLHPEYSSDQRGL